MFLQAALPAAPGPVLAQGLLQGAAFRCEGYEECLAPALVFEMGITGSSFSSALAAEGCWSQTIKLHPSPGQGGSAVNTPGHRDSTEGFLSWMLFLLSVSFH